MLPSSDARFGAVFAEEHLEEIWFSSQKIHLMVNSPLIRPAISWGVIFLGFP